MYGTFEHCGQEYEYNSCIDGDTRQRMMEIFCGGLMVAYLCESMSISAMIEYFKDEYTICEESKIS